MSNITYHQSFFPNRLKQHAEEALVHKTIESLKKIRINRPLPKEIRQTDNYPKYMKDLVANMQLTEEDDEVSMNPRCSALLQNQLPPKENDLRTFILHCSIGRMPVILGRPILGTAHAKVDIFRKTISLEVGNEKVKLNLYEEKLHWCTPISRKKEGVQEIWASCSPFEEKCDGDDDDLEGIIDYLEPRLYDGFIGSDDEEYKERKCRLLGIPYVKPPPILIEKVSVTRYSIGPGEVYTKMKVSEVEELSRTRGNIANIRAGIME
ncbi:hypothetical protein Tco_0722237 [Tanacetum coccineum]